MKRICLILILLISISSCKSSKRSKAKKASTTKTISKKKPKERTHSEEKLSKSKVKKAETSKADQIIDFAKRFKGVRYRWGGTNKLGMDCSGLVYTSFRAYNITLPRISRDMAKKGHKIALGKVQTGDLLFFKTGNRRNSINHVGLVVKSKSGVIEFIHATSRKGVIISNLSDTYWKATFYQARRIL